MKREDSFFIKKLFTRQYYQVCDLQLRFLFNLLAEVLSELDIVEYLKEDFRSFQDIKENFNFHSQSDYSIRWLLSFLEDMDFLETSEDKNGIRFRVKRDVYLIDSCRIARQIIKLDQSSSISVELMRNIALDYGSFLKGDKTGLDILFGDERIKLWANYFNNNYSGYSVFNIFGAYGFCKWFSDVAGGKILELGGGSGGAAVKVFEIFKEKLLLDRITEYFFTDISSVFLRQGYRLISEKISNQSFIVFKKLDFNKSFRIQEIMNESVDVVYGVNALHVSYDLLFTLREIYGVLKNKGILVISELIRPSENKVLFQEFIFNLLENYHGVKTSPYLRPNYGFLTLKHWERNLSEAGFCNIEFISNINCEDFMDSCNHHSSVSACVIKAQKSI